MAVSLNDRHSAEDEAVVDINTTPLIDVMLVLLIMLIITIPARTDAVKLDMPAPEAVAVLQPSIVKLAIDADGTIRWDGAVLSDRATLEDYLRAAARQVPPPEIHIDPDQRARYAFVAMVLAAAQRAGVAKIGLIGNAAPDD